MARSTEPELTGSAFEAVSRALAHLGLHAAQAPKDGTGDLVLGVTIDDRKLWIPLNVKAYGTGAHVSEIIDRHCGDDRSRMLVADKITIDARDRLNEAGWSWLDRRGRLHLTGSGVRIDADVPPNPRSTRAPTRRNPITGPGGLAVAYWLCDHPGNAVSPTGLMSVLGFAPSTISTANRRLVDAGLVGDDGAGLFPELFWELAAVWQPDRVWLAAEPPPPQPSPDPAAHRWVRVGTAAAAALGAPVVSPDDGPVELYVSGPVELDIARRRYHAATPGWGAASVAVAPVRAVTAPPEEGSAVPVVGGWPTASLLAIALDLAQDRARGRQILDEWEVDGAVWR
ncbi:hypothetical protein BH23ACT2_BH23ACT2_04160 [soil metagenome]